MASITDDTHSESPMKISIKNDQNQSLNENENIDPNKSNSACPLNHTFGESFCEAHEKQEIDNLGTYLTNTNNIINKNTNSYNENRRKSSTAIKKAKVNLNDLIDDEMIFSPLENK